jgi:hypothetical protein
MSSGIVDPIFLALGCAIMLALSLVVVWSSSRRRGRPARSRPLVARPAGAGAVRPAPADTAGLAEDPAGGSWDDAGFGALSIDLEPMETGWLWLLSSPGATLASGLAFTGEEGISEARRVLDDLLARGFEPELCRTGRRMSQLLAPAFAVRGPAH